MKSPPALASSVPALAMVVTSSSSVSVTTMPSATYRLRLEVQVILPLVSSRVIPSQVERSTVLPASAATVYVVMTASSAGTVQVTVPVISSRSFLSTARVPKSPEQSETRAGTRFPSSVFKSVYVVCSASVAGVVQVILPLVSSRVIPSQVERSTVLPASAATVYVVMTASSAGTV